MTRAGQTTLQRTAPCDDAVYVGADRARAQRFSVGAWSFGLALMALVGVRYPPTTRGPGGWWVLGAMLLLLLGLLVSSVVLRLTFRHMLLQQYAVAGGLAVVQYLSGGWTSPCQTGFTALIVYASFVHPRPRSLPFVATCGVLSLLPAAYGPLQGHVLRALLDLLLAVGLGVFANQLITTVRQQRLELAERGEAAREDARRDPLTGLDNRRAFVEALSSAVVRTRSERHVLSVALGDVDLFKAVNERFGHVVGDACLVAVGHALRDASRSSEQVFRWGGDEFAVLLHGGDVAAAASRLEAAVRAAVTTPDGLPVTLTLGVVSDDGITEPEQLVDLADRALLARKNTRRAALSLS